MGATLPSTVSGIRLCLLYKSLLYMRMPWECGICFSLNTNVFSFLSQDGFTPLLIASQNGHPETVQLLLSRGANINLQAKVDMLPNIFLYLRWKEASNTERSPLSTFTGVHCPTPVVDSLYSTPSVSVSTGYYIHWWGVLVAMETSFPPPFTTTCPSQYVHISIQFLGLYKPSAINLTVCWIIPHMYFGGQPVCGQ